MTFSSLEIFEDFVDSTRNYNIRFDAVTQLVLQHRYRNRRNVANWKSRQTKATLQRLRREEYLRNRDKRIASAKAYQKLHYVKKRL